MLPSNVTLSYDGRRFSFTSDADKVLKGKLACDCTKSQLIREYCDGTFPALRCGHKIGVVFVLASEAQDSQVN
ncbi:MAG TPA: hypothetical protein VKT81_02030 [Bryobacteraceae bacterium]|nr:hypothetical protein [Bryobacteraceae bacterium]